MMVICEMCVFITRVYIGDVSVLTGGNCGFLISACKSYRLRTYRTCGFIPMNTFWTLIY